MRPRNHSASSSSSRDSYLSSSSVSSLDEDELNGRITPNWECYRKLFEQRGYRLDTARDARQYYERVFQGSIPTNVCHRQGYARACRANPDALCKDAGLPDNLFRGTRIFDGKRFVVKAVCLRSRQYEVIRMLSAPPLRDDPMNHTIPVLDLIEVPESDVAFIVQEEWSSEIIDPCRPCPPIDFLRAVRQCIEGLAFMHAHGIVHLDVSLRNILTDFHGRYSYIDFELSRRYTDKSTPPRISGCKGTEVPPELERGEESDPFKVDVWALAVVILRACKLSGHDLPCLVQLAQPMLNASYSARPSAREVLLAFDRLVARIVPNWTPQRL
ncbi:kinase-like protein [Fomitiporia mediterranea MF3/22]|uniref:kinase-like protein n=1 Tax=Fomitiporia mediterranea (strain MF3/22) TaxID=694068 RepID=UPI0004407705|nr:kinase-like protein [Fomitiporia mediterranea MF3/22]EJD02290.1 kinase-like protein [Fomitiporia mediterranea MF3/22]